VYDDTYQLCRSCSVAGVAKAGKGGERRFCDLPGILAGPGKYF
jgi:hypothetical protein